MSFLQPLMLAALPLVSLPLIIHLINQRRFQTVPWAAMMFLMTAKALSRGYSRLRNWLIMAMRMAAIAALLVAVGRPLSRGWLALAGGARPDLAVVILDRSPSMQQRSTAAADTKLETGRRQLVESLQTLGASRCVLFTEPAVKPIELASPAQIADLPVAGPAAAAADIPMLMQAAYDFMVENKAGTTEVWICSDQRQNDWSPENGVWGGLRDAFAKLPQQVRFQLLSYDEPAAENVAVRVTDAKVEKRGDGRELLVTVAASRLASGDKKTVPLRFEIGGVASTVDLELVGREAVLKNHAIPLERAAGSRGWGKVAIGADSNAADNEFYFVFDEPALRKTLVVAEDQQSRRVLSLLAGIPPEKGLQAKADAIGPSDLVTADWEGAALLLWQADLPEGKAADLVNEFVNRGGKVIFFPPENPAKRTFAGLSWTDWTAHADPIRPAPWRNDQDLLVNTLSGGALQVGELKIRRSCGIAGEHVPLAPLEFVDQSGAQVTTPLLARAADESNGIYFCGTTPNGRDSSLTSDGVVLYAIVQRAIDRGQAALGKARQLDAGPTAAFLADEKGGWNRLAGPADALSTEMGRHAGVFANGDRLVAVNRPAVEDTAEIAGNARIDEVFGDLPFARLVGKAGNADSLVQEIWRAFLISMMLALIAEGLLCLPRSSAAERSPFEGMRPLEPAV
ncbi:MAG: BatA domain-containing protein [Planctomycetia bacterium]|jgi:hypothetical protein